MTAPRLAWLYCTASGAERLPKALSYQPDAVVYDLEDAVAPSQKADARQNLARFLNGLEAHSPSAGSVTTVPRPHIQVRVNAIESSWLDDDLAMLREISSVDSIRMPKVESAQSAAAVMPQLRPGVLIHALIETARGVENMHEICASESVTSVSLGEADLRSELRFTGSTVLDHIRTRLVIALAAAGKPAPMGAAYLNVLDDEGLAADSRRLADMGFLGRTAIHPRQLPIIRAAFRPTDEEYAAACRVLDSLQYPEADDAGASTLADGTFIDRPVIVRARDTVDLWRAVRPR